MGFKINPLGIDFSATGSGGGGGGGGPADRYTRTFNATSDWGSPSGGEYSITVSAATHAKGQYPCVMIFEDIGGSIYELVTVNALQVNATGDVTIKVLETPNNRFAGMLLIL